MTSFLRSSSGYSFLFILLTVMLLGIMQGMIGTSWRQIMQREREEELLFRGLQIQEAITRWHQPLPGGQRHVATPLNDLKDLLQDPRTPTKVRHLRKLYRDPLTGQEWNLLREANRGIVGVASVSEQEPIRKTNFPDQLQNFAGAQRYTEWQFVYRPAQPAADPNREANVPITNSVNP